jgi:peptidyl-tRNA hydrolase
VPVEAFVLNDFLMQEKKLLPNILGACQDGLECWCKEGIVKTMNDFNSKIFTFNE